MELSGLTNEVLRLLLAQNNLAISGSCEQLIERLGTISPSTSTETRTRSSKSSRPRAKCPRSTRQVSGHNDNLDGRRDPALEDEIPVDLTAEERGDNRNNHNDIQDADCDEAPPLNSAIDPTNLAPLIGDIVDQKLKSFMPAQSSAPSPQTAPPASASPPQPSTTRQLGDPTFVARLLSQSSTSSADFSLPLTTPPASSLADHVSQKTNHAILRGEYVEFDLLLPEIWSLLSDNDLSGLSISLGGKQVDLPNPPKKKTHVDSIDKWLFAFAIYCTILLSSFPWRVVEMFSPIRRSSDQPN